MSDIRVSVIMPFYNEEKYLSYAIESIIAQTYPYWELIIVNDGSTDRSEEIVKTYNDPRIKYYSYIENRGKPYANNLGLEKAKGKYILIFDADDIAYPNMLSSQAEYLDRHPECIHVQGAMDYIDEEGKVIQKEVESKYKTDIERRAYELYGNCILGATSMFRRAVIEQYGLKFDLEALVSQDYLLWIDMLPYGEFACIDEIVFQYRCSYGSNSHRIMDNNREWYDNFMRKIFMHAWTQRGYKLEESDIRFIHDFLYQKRLLWRLSDIKQGVRTYGKVKKQSEGLSLKEKELIPHFFIKEGILLYKDYLLHNRFTMVFKQKNKAV